MRFACAVLAAALFFGGCGGEPAPDEPERDSASVGVSETAAEENSLDPGKAAAHTEILAHVTAIGLDGIGIPGLIPIATRKPNAFDEPVVQAALTGPDGHSHAHLPAGEHLFVRVWDPTLQLFASNYYEVLPGAGNETEDMQVIMAPAARLRAKVLSPDGSILANTRVDIQLHHLQEGPWWPARGSTQDDGTVVFERVPPGEFRLEIWSGETGRIQVPGIKLPPKGELDIGAVKLLAP